MLDIVLIVSLLILIVIKIVSKITMGRCKSNVCLVGKTALVTGGNSGIGYQTALALAGKGCRVIIADKDNCDETRKKIINETGNTNIVIKNFDLASLSSVRELAKDFTETEERLDILINNAGTSGLGHKKTKDGLHIGMQVNHFGPFLLTYLLVDLLKKSAPSRIVFVSSIAAFLNTLTLKNLNYSPKESKHRLSEFTIYSMSKLCNLIAADGFASRLRKFDITCNSLHPGIVYTQIYNKYYTRQRNGNILIWLQHFFLDLTVLKWFSKTPEEGAQTSIYLATAKEVKNVTGKFFADCTPLIKPRAAFREDFCNQIWTASEDYVQLAQNKRL